MAESAKGSWASAARVRAGRGGRRAGGARLAVIELLAGEDCCLSAQEIHERLSAAGARIGTASVYRALDLLQREGLVSRIEVGGGGARYERALPGGEHHHHVICDRCSAITPFEDPDLERAIHRVSGRIGHRVSGHDVVIRGICRSCAAGSE